MNMSKGFVILFVLILLMTSCTIALEPVKSQSLTGIIINADGSVTPSGVAMQMNGNTYRITADLNSSITVERGNIVLDGANHTLQGPGISQNAIAITLRASNVTVENLRLTGWKASSIRRFQQQHHNRKRVHGQLSSHRNIRR